MLEGRLLWALFTVRFVLNTLVCLFFGWQVDAEGKSWRSGAIVEQRSLNQWFLRITDYGDRLLDDLDKVCVVFCLTVSCVTLCTEA